MTSSSSSKLAPLVLGGLWGLSALLGACQRGSYLADSGDDDGVGPCAGEACGSGGSGSTPDDIGEVTTGAYELAPDWDGPCEPRDVIDVNLGHTAARAVRALHCQILGAEPDAADAAEWTARLESKGHTRRVDVARTFCQRARRDCSFEYTDPWRAQVLHEEGCQKKTARDLGAVLMFFGNCPGGVNCGMDWANTHAVGMNRYHALYAAGDRAAGFYNPGNVGFWTRELYDARWAGLQFLLLNVYGPDIEGNVLGNLTEALGEVSDIQIALFDDTWIWGRGTPPGNLAGIWGHRVGEPWTSLPDLNDVDGAAQILFESKWRPFFQGIPEERWYKRDGRPLIYFYNAGTFAPQARQMAAVLARMKELFQSEFGVTPLVAVDTAFFFDDHNPAADARFTWNSGAGNPRSSFTLPGGVRLDHSMVRWDSKNRYAQEMTDVATPEDRIWKGPEDLEAFLASSADADVAVLATWNDLGEGTGVTRNYDYFHGGRWLEPHTFMSLIRNSQCASE